MTCGQDCGAVGSEGIRTCHSGQQYGEDGYDVHENTEQAIKQGIEEAIEIVKVGGVDEN